MQPFTVATRKKIAITIFSCFVIKHLGFVCFFRLCPKHQHYHKLLVQSTAHRCHPDKKLAEFPFVEEYYSHIQSTTTKKMNEDNTQQARTVNLSSRYGKESRKRAQRSLLKQKSQSRSFLFQNTVKNISICQNMGQMKNISRFHNAFFQEFVSYFQLACITL